MILRHLHHQRRGVLVDPTAQMPMGFQPGIQAVDLKLHFQSGLGLPVGTPHGRRSKLIGFRMDVVSLR